MEKLFKQFEQLSTQAQKLLKDGINQMEKGYAPTAELRENITAALQALCTSYDDIRRSLPEHILAEELPDGNLSVYEYAKIWENSIISQRKAVRNVLEEFIRVCSDEKKYMDAIEGYICDAKTLLDNVDCTEPTVESSDVSMFQLFLDGVKADLELDKELSDRLMDGSGFNSRIVMGLHNNKYYIRDAALTGESISDTDNEELVGEIKSATSSDSSETVISSVIEEPQGERLTPDIHVDMDASPSAESAEKCTLEEEATPERPSITEKPDTAVESADEEYIHPTNLIKEVKLPSDKKLRDLIGRTGEVFHFLIDVLGFTGLLDEAFVFEFFSKTKKPITKEQCMDAFEVLERKGLLCTYNYGEQRILCFTELMKECLQKVSLCSILKRVYKLKSTVKIYITAKQDMPLNWFEEHLLRVYDYMCTAGVIFSDADIMKKLKSAKWDNDRERFFEILTREENGDLPLCIVNVSEFATTAPKEGEGVLCFAEELPDMSEANDPLHYCLTASGLFNWADGEWTTIVTRQSTEDSQDEPTEECAEEMSQVTSDDGLSNIADESETTAALQETVTPVENDVPKSESSEDLYLDELSEKQEVEMDVAIDDYASLSAVEIAQQLLNSAESGSIPSDENMALLIHKLLAEGMRSHDVKNCHDQLVEAIMLAKSLSSMEKYPLCGNIYSQLHAAIPCFNKVGGNGGTALSDIFAEETEYTPVTRLCAYIYGLLFPAHAHDYTFVSLYKDAFDDYEAQFPGLELLKPLFHKAIECAKSVPTAFSSANLAAMSNSRIQQEHMNSICKHAKVLLEPPTIKALIHGVPELIDLCFGSKTDLYSALQIVAQNDAEMRELVKEEWDKFSNDDEVDTQSLENLLDSQWPIAAQKYSNRRVGIRYTARKQLLQALEERIKLLHEWLCETDTKTATDVETLRTLRNEVVRIIEDCIAKISQAPYSISYGIMKASLQLILSRLQNRDDGIDFSTMLRSGTIVIDNGEPVLNDALNEIKFAEPWRMMLRHIACTEYDLNRVYDRIIDADTSSELYDNFGQLEAIGNLIGANPDEYMPTDESVRDAISSANLQAKSFKERLEISYAYNRIGENDRERMVMLTDADTSDFRGFFYDHKAFGCWRGFLKALRMQIRETSNLSMRDVSAQLDQAKATLLPEEESPLLTEAERLIAEEQNYAVAEDYIHRFRNGERALPFEACESTTNYFLDFISDAVFNELFSACEKNKQDTMFNWAVKYIRHNTPAGWTTRHIEDAQRFIEKWPRRKQNVNPLDVQEYFKLLGLNVQSCTKYTRGNEICCTLNVSRSEQNLADYRHPISMFGTQMKPQIEVACLFGRRTANQLIDDACKLGISGTFIVLLDADLSALDRRSMAQYFFTQKNVGQASFLVIDRVLALYLALRSSNERLPAMLQCTLPYTIYQPFTNGSGSTADEMFFGRVSELASIRDMTGASIVYGGRQLGKTALLERAMHLDHNPSRKEYAIKADFKGQRGERDFLDILIPACNNAFEKNGFKLEYCLTIRDFCTQIRRLLENDTISILRLLLDETDDFLDSISASSYNEILPLIELQRSSNRRFKFVLAGLHNVCRAKNATRNNGLFGQLGDPLCVKPLTAADARNLLVRPLRYLGFRVSNESHIDTILINTNYYPGIIQFFGYTLVQTLATNYTQYYDAARENPPFELHDEQLAAIMNSRDLNRNIKDRIRWTLEMDERYYMLARCIAALYYYYGNDYSEISKGFDVVSICKMKDMYNIHCLASLSEKEIAALLDEMEEMGILTRPNPEDNRYLLRRRSFIDVIGPNFDALEHDIKLNNKEMVSDA